MAFSAWPESDMQPSADKARTMSGKPLFSRCRDSLAPTAAKTPLDRQPSVPPPATKPRKSHHSDRRDSGRVFKRRDNEKEPAPRNHLSEKLTESLNVYRENLYDTATDGLENIGKDLANSLEDLSVNLEGHFQKLSEIEEPLQKPFAGEALTKPCPTDPNVKEDLLLKDGITEFRQLYEEVGQTIDSLWQEWEKIQFEIMSLAVECFGKESIEVMPLQTDDIKTGQQERLDKMLQSALNIHKEASQGYAEYQQDLRSFETNMSEISNQTNITVDKMQEASRKMRASKMKNLSSLLQDLVEN